MSKPTKQQPETDSKWLFYYKDKSREIVPYEDEEVNLIARHKLDAIINDYQNEIPEDFKNNWESVKLFDSKGNIEKAHSIMITPKKGSYSLKNKLNHMTGRDWTIFSCSWFIFNALPKDLKEEKEACENSSDHPATYSPTMMEDFIKFFTKEGMSVLDPFSGIGSTLVGCRRTNRIGYGVELNPKYYETILKRVPEFSENVKNDDCRNIGSLFEDKKFDFCISSPPYWDVLNRSTANFEKTRKSRGLDVNYSNEELDLGNISDYKTFLDNTVGVYKDIYPLLNDGSYLVIIVKNIKKGGKFYPLAWDIAKELSSLYELKDEKIWIQDKVGLAPYGYPYSWAANILHHYCLVLRKEAIK